MSGLLRRLRRRRPATVDETGSATTGSSEPAGASATPADMSGGQLVPSSGDQPTNVLPRTSDEPAGPVVSSQPGDAAAPIVSPQPGTPEQAAAGPVVSPDAGPPEQAAAPAAEQPTPAGQPVVAGTAAVATSQRPAARDLPAGVDPAELESGPIASARRGKLRRRLRYLRRVRELLLRDLGGFTYELHRTAGGTLNESHHRIAVAKADRIGALDAEVRDIESRLGQAHGEPMLREPGIGGTCPECGELHGSDARFCARCGAPLDEKARAQRAAEIAAAAPPATHEQPTPEPGPASALWAAGPRPSSSAEPTADSPRLSAATSEWLAGRAQPSDLDQPAAPDEEAAPSGDQAATAGDEEADSAGEPAPPEGSTATDQPEPTDKPSPSGAPTATDQPEPTDKPSPSDAPTETDQPQPTGEPARAPDEPTDSPAASENPAATGQPEARGDAAGDESRRAGTEDPGFEPNGRRDDDVPPPVRSRDALGSRGEKRP